MLASHRKVTRRWRWRRASWCSNRSSPASGSRGQTAAGTDAPHQNRAGDRIRTCSAAADVIETMRGEAALGSDPTRVRRATVNDLATVVDLRLALLREYADHPIYGRLH